MNKHIHRLVFDRRRGMRVPAAEHARSAGKAASGQTRARAVAGVVALVMAAGAQAQMVSVNPASVSAMGASARLSASSMPSGALSANRSVADMVSQVLASGRPNLPVFSTLHAGENKGVFDLPGVSDDGKIMTLLQKSGAIIVNWDSFDIGKGYTMRFVQPDGGRALNKVRGGDASLIDGALQANGEVMIENGAGIIFGRNARVDVGSLVATALSIAQQGIGDMTDPNNPNALNIYRLRDGSAVFGGDENAKAGFVATEQGAVIQALPGGKVLMVAPRVVNKGLIESPEGQTVLAAGKTVYLFAPTDAAQRGLLVAVDNFSEETLNAIKAEVQAAKDAGGTGLNEDKAVLGTVENVREGGASSGHYASGLVRADKGTINLVGAAIRQKGQITATTAVKGQNGGIFLSAMKDTFAPAGSSYKVAKTLGTVELGAGSITEVLPSAEGLVSADGSQVATQSVEAVIRSDTPGQDVVLHKIGVRPGEVWRATRTPEEPLRPSVPAEDASAEIKAKYQADLAKYQIDKAAFDRSEQVLQRSSDNFYRSRIDILGSEIVLRSGARLQAPAGEINVLAAADWQYSPLRVTENSSEIVDGSRILMEAGAVVDVSGVDLLLPSQRHQLKVQMFSIELADSPLQRAGVIYRKTVMADARRALDLGDASGYYSNLRYTAAELSSAGGIVRMQAQGALMQDARSAIDFSGGSVTYDAGPVVSSVLLRNGAITLAGNARRDVVYDAFISDPTRADAESLARYGLGDITLPSPANQPGQFVGKSAGVVMLGAPVQSLAAQLDGSVRMSELQRSSGAIAERDPGLDSMLKPSIALPPVWMGLDDLQASDRLVRLPQLLTQEAGEGASGYQPYRYAELRPTAGLLVVGREIGQETSSRAAANLVSSVHVSGLDRVAPSISASMSEEQWQRLLTEVGTTTTLTTRQLQQAGLAGLSLFADTVRVGQDGATAPGATLELAAGGSFQVKARAGDVVLDGRVVTPGGRIEVLAQGGELILTEGSKLDASGTRRDDRAAGASALAPALKGGSVTLRASGDIVLEQGSEVDVSGTAWRGQDGRLVTGRAGAITLQTNLGVDGAGSTMPDGDIVLGGSLSGFDFTEGGSLSLQGLPAVVLGGQRAGAFSLDRNLYADRGFGTLQVTSLGDVEVSAGAQIRPTLVNMLSVAAIDSRLSGSTFRLGILDAGLRSGLDLSLSARTEADLLVQNGLPLGADLTVEAGALIDAGAGGSIDLRAGGSMDMAGTLRALGGDVSLGLLGVRGASSVNDAEKYGHLEGQAIHLRDGSLIDVSGTVRAVPVRSAFAALFGSSSLSSGEVLAGGTVTLGGDDGTPVRGQLLMEQGATIRMNGASALLTRGGTTLPSRISAGAGTLNIMSTDGFSLLGTIEARAPDASVAGGTLNIALSREGKIDQVAPGGTAYPSGQQAGLRTLRITDSKASARQLDAGDRKFGEGVLSADLINGSGFDRVQLRADEAIELNGGVSLRADAARTRLQSVVLDAPVLALTDAFRSTSQPSGATVPDHVIEAHHVAVGPTTRNGGTPGTTPASQRVLEGDDWLAIRAGLIEVNGDTAVQGAGRIDLQAVLGRASATDLTRRNGEIRFIGQRPLEAGIDADRSLRGQFSFQGTLNLTAGQVYATTLSDYTIRGTGDSTLNLSAPGRGSTSVTPLSALATLRMKASEVNLDGVVRQPVGSIEVTADRLTLGSNARLSVSADGTTVPVGMTVNNTQWLYSPEGGVGGTVPDVGNVVQDITALPIVKQITLNGATLSLGASSLLEAQAGGDIVAWQFNPGVGGSTDTFLRPGLFAILPNYTYDFAPYDADIRARTQQAGTDLKAGDQVTITTGNGVLAAGTYTLMDARYGILPGAVLVSATRLDVGRALPVAVRNDDGSVIVSGYRTATGSRQNGGNDVRQALLLEPQSTVRAKSDVTVVSGNAFQKERSNRSDVALPLPGDGGRVSLLSESVFDWKTRFNLQASDGFKAGELDLSMPDIVVRKASAVASGAAAGVVDLDSLNALGADSVLLGGIRTTLADGSVRVDRKAATVTFQAGNGEGGQPPADTISTGGELLAVATRQVVVGEGLTIASTGAETGESRRYRVQGDGALLQVGHRSATDVVVEGGTAASTAELRVGGTNEGAAPVTLSGASVQLDSTGKVELSDRLMLDTQAVGIGAGSIVIGEVAGDAGDALHLTGGLLERLNQAERLALRANGGSLALASGTQLGSAATQRITLDAPALTAQVAAGMSPETAAQTVTRVSAQNVVLRNSSGQSAAAAGTAAGQLRIEARPVLRDGATGGITVATSGSAGQRWAFGSTTLHSTGDIVFSGTGRTEAQGDVVLSAARVTATGDSRQQLTAGGDMQIVRTAGGRSLNEALGAGGQLRLEGRTLTQQGTLDVEAGQLALVARGNGGAPADALVFADGSVTSVDGRVHRINDDYAVASGGGVLTALAQQGRIVVEGRLSAAAPVMPAGVKGEAPAAGSIILQAGGEGGTVLLGTQARLDVSAAAGQAGSVAVDTRTLASVHSADAGASVRSGVDQLVISSRNADGSSLREFSVRQREGNLALNTGVRAARVELSADAGSLTLGGAAAVDATTAGGGVVQLQASGDLVLSDGARIEARSTREGANGGDVLLSSGDGYVRMGAATVVADSAQDARDGRIVVRAQQTRNAQGQYTGMKVLPLAGSAPVTLKAGRVQLEGVRLYTGAQLSSLGTAATSATNQNLTEMVNAAAGFAANQSAILTQAGLSSTANARVHGAAEIRAQGNFTIANDLVLSASTAGQPMDLTVRSAGDLTVNGSVSAGLSNALTTGTVQAGEGASLRFVAGADLTAADLNATRTDAGRGHFTLASNKLIRTTTGSIDVHASGDVRLMAGTVSTPSSIYVTGGLSALDSDEVFATENTSAALTRATSAFRSAAFTERGERLTVSAGGKVGSFASVTTSNGVTQYVDQMLTQGTGNYFYHGGNPQAQLLSQRVPVAWWAGFNEFRQGFGSFGGGNVDVRAGGSVSNLAVVAPTNARSVLDVDASGNVVSSTLKILNGGDVNISAGGDIVGGVYFLGRGEGRLSAGGSVLEGADQVADGAVPGSAAVFDPAAMLALMDGHWSVNAAGDLKVSHVYNPTIVPFRFTGGGNLNGSTGGTTAASGLTNANASVYYTYSSDAGVSLASLQGNVSLAPNAQNFNRMHATSAVGNLDLSHVTVGRDASVPASVLPPVLSMVSLNGDVIIDTAGRATSSARDGSNGASGSALYVMPSASSDVNVYAGRDLRMQANLQLLDAQQLQLGWPTPERVAIFAAAPANNSSLASTFSSLGFNLGAAGATVPNTLTGTETSATAIRVSNALSALDDKPLADLGQAGNTNLVRFIAGRDVTFLERNEAGRDITSFLRSSRPAEIEAGRDIANPHFLGQNFDDADVTRLSAGRDIIGTELARPGVDRGVVIGGPGSLRLEAGRDLDLNQMAGVLAIGNLVNAGLTPASAKITVAAGMDRTVNIDELRARHGSSPDLRTAINRALDASSLLPANGASWSELSDGDAFAAFGQLGRKRQVDAVQTYLDAAFAAAYLPGDAGRTPEYYRSAEFQIRKQEAMWARIQQAAGEAQSIAVSSDAKEEASRKQRRLALFAAAESVVDLAGLGKTFDRQGDINVGQSRVHNLGQGGGSALGQADDGKGGIDVVAAGQVLAGLPTSADNPGGFINFNGGSFRALSGGDFLAGDQKVIAMGRGNLMIYTVDGSIDSGKGSNTAASAPLPTRRFNPLTGRVETVGRPPTAGSGFQKIQTPSDMTPVIGLYAPNGEIRALDAFIKGDGNISILSDRVLGASNIGGASGVAAPPAPSVSLSLAPKVSDTAAGTREMVNEIDAKATAQVNSMLTVDLLGFGDAATAAGEASAAPHAPAERARRRGNDEGI